jgi:hypothetical protein
MSEKENKTNEAKEEMEIVEVKMDVPKDYKEVVDLVGKVIDKVKNGDDFNSYLGLIGELSGAVEGITNVGPAIMGQYRDECAGYTTKVLVEKLIPGEE